MTIQKHNQAVESKGSKRVQDEFVNNLATLVT